MQDLNDEIEEKNGDRAESLPSIMGVSLSEGTKIPYPILDLAEIITDPAYASHLDLFLNYLYNPFQRPKNWTGEVAEYLGNDELPIYLRENSSNVSHGELPSN